MKVGLIEDSLVLSKFKSTYPGSCFQFFERSRIILVDGWQGLFKQTELFAFDGLPFWIEVFGFFCPHILLVRPNTLRNHFSTGHTVALDIMTITDIPIFARNIMATLQPTELIVPVPPAA